MAVSGPRNPHYACWNAKTFYGLSIPILTISAALIGLSSSTLALTSTTALDNISVRTSAQFRLSCSIVTLVYTATVLFFFSYKKSLNPAALFGFMFCGVWWLTNTVFIYLVSEYVRNATVVRMMSVQAVLCIMLLVLSIAFFRESVQALKRMGDVGCETDSSALPDYFPLMQIDTPPPYESLAPESPGKPGRR